MRVVILGAGEVGYHIADRLSREGHAVSLIERRREKIADLEGRLDVLLVEGTGASQEALDQARVAGADLFIAVTDQDEVNIVACMLAHEKRAKRIICRIWNPEYAGPEWRTNAQKLGIDLLINPRAVVADEICDVVSYPLATHVAEFGDGRVVFIGYPVGEDNPLAGVTLRELGDLRGIYRLVVAALWREGKTIIPRGDDRIQGGDIIYLVCRTDELPAVNYLFGFEKRQTRRVMILGGGGVGESVAAELCRRKFEVKVLERDRARCDILAEVLPRAAVIHAEGTDVDTLREEGVEDTDVFVAVTEADERNMLCSLLAKSLGAERAVALVGLRQYVSLAPNLGIDACISPRLATAAAILKFVRRGEVLSMAMVEQCEAEVMEIILHEGSRVLGKPLRDLSIPRGSIVGAIVRGKEVIIPGGADSLLAEDRAIIFTLPEAIPEVERFFN